MQVYNYHRETGEYLGSSEAKESPLEPGKYLIPAYATKIKPPAVVGNEVAVFEGGTWTVKEDHRGKLWAKDEAQEVTLTGIGPIPDGLTNISPEAVPFPKWTGSAWETDTATQTPALKQRLKRELETMASADVALFRMVLAMWDVGVTKGLWVNADLPTPIRAVAAQWKQKLQEIDS